MADQAGRASFRLLDRYLKVQDLIGRSVVVTADPDDLGEGNHGSSTLDGNSGERQVICFDSSLLSLCLPPVANIDSGAESSHSRPE